MDPTPSCSTALAAAAGARPIADDFWARLTSALDAEDPTGVPTPSGPAGRRRRTAAVARAAVVAARPAPARAPPVPALVPVALRRTSNVALLAVAARPPSWSWLAGEHCSSRTATARTGSPPTTTARRPQLDALVTDAHPSRRRPVTDARRRRGRHLGRTRAGVAASDLRDGRQRRRPGRPWDPLPGPLRLPGRLRRGAHLAGGGLRRLVGGRPRRGARHPDPATTRAPSPWSPWSAPWLRRASHPAPGRRLPCPDVDGEARLEPFAFGRRARGRGP